MFRKLHQLELFLCLWRGGKTLERFRKGINSQGDTKRETLLILIFLISFYPKNIKDF